MLLLNDDDIKFWDSVELGLILLYLNLDCFFFIFSKAKFICSNTEREVGVILVINALTGDEVLY
jgi:hypothetical protein